MGGGGEDGFLERRRGEIEERGVHPEPLEAGLAGKSVADRG